ncbi:MAG: response regulator [Tepidisphaeraceae bacterium]|jgi:DNA-binding response OmpR family regulator
MGIRENSRVLIVDDNRDVTRALTILLRDEGYDPVAFHTAESAGKFIQDYRPDVALLDIHLPDQSGLELAVLLRQRHGNELPIVIFSGDTSIDMLRASTDAGATHFFGKPVNISSLLDFLDAMTSNKTATPA